MVYASVCGLGLSADQEALCCFERLSATVRVCNLS
jgi:hypothetical protein